MALAPDYSIEYWGASFGARNLATIRLMPGTLRMFEFDPAGRDRRGLRTFRSRIPGNVVVVRFVNHYRKCRPAECLRSLALVGNELKPQGLRSWQPLW